MSRTSKHVPEILVGIALVSAWVAIIFLKPDWANGAQHRMIPGAFALNSAIILGIWMFASREALRSVRYWLLLLPVLGVHAVGFVVLWKSEIVFGLIWFVVLYAVELPFLFQLTSQFAITKTDY